MVCYGIFWSGQLKWDFYRLVGRLAAQERGEKYSGNVLDQGKDDFPSGFSVGEQTCYRNERFM